MERKIENRRTGGLWVERIVWNAVAATALAALIMLLLFSLQWLDQLDRGDEPERARIDTGNALGAAPKIENRADRKRASPRLRPAPSNPGYAES